MGGTSNAKALLDLVAQVRKTPGWTVIEQRKGSGVTVHAPSGESASFNTAGSGSFSKLPNIRARIRRMGWDPDGAEKAKDRQAKKRLAESRQETDDAIARAQREGERRAHAEQLAKARAALSAVELQLRAARLAYERAERDHRQAAALVHQLEGVTP
ncbi:hypothetical protein [Streptomyces sp. gCLA4]|uniref:hypothetical protein n=1 Tax=Streptomyces sp. gCLA4 TaxID=1873416 RepID=UPI0015FF67FF|nr:hypothetical protein [Streptomyces sp. gCLA4]